MAKYCFYNWGLRLNYPKIIKKYNNELKIKIFKKSMFDTNELSILKINYNI